MTDMIAAITQAFKKRKEIQKTKFSEALSAAIVEQDKEETKQIENVIEEKKIEIKDIELPKSATIESYISICTNTNFEDSKIKLFNDVQAQITQVKPQQELSDYEKDRNEFKQRIKQLRYEKMNIINSIRLQNNQDTEYLKTFKRYCFDLAFLEWVRWNDGVQSGEIKNPQFGKRLLVPTNLIGSTCYVQGYAANTLMNVGIATIFGNEIRVYNISTGQFERNIKSESKPLLVNIVFPIKDVYLETIKMLDKRYGKIVGK